MDEINPTLAYSSSVLFVQMMMQTISVWMRYFELNVMHPHTPNKTDNSLLIFIVWSSISFNHLLFSPFQKKHTFNLDQGMQFPEVYSLESLCQIDTLRSSNHLEMTFISSVMQTLGSNKPWYEKLSLGQNMWSVSSGMLSTTYLASSHAHGRP